MALDEKLDVLPRPWEAIVKKYIGKYDGKKEVMVGIGEDVYELLVPMGYCDEGVKHLQKITDNLAKRFNLDRSDVNLGFCNPFETATAGYPHAVHYLYRYSDETKYEFGPHGKKGLY